LQYVVGADLGSNWGANHGSAVHNVLEAYAGGDRDWEKNLIAQYTKLMVDRRGNLITKGSHTGKVYPSGTRLLHHAKPEDYLNVKKQCDKCSLFDSKTGNCIIEGIPAKDTEGCGRLLFGDKNVDRIRQGSSWRIMTDHLNNFGYMYDLDRPKYEGHDGPHGIEVQFRLECDPGKPVIGYIDYLYVDEDGVLHMQDYKTSKKWEPSQNEKAIKADIQARIYAWALKQMFPDYPLQMLTFNFFMNRPITIMYNDAEIEQTRRYLSCLWDEIAGHNEKNLTRIYDDASKVPNICKNLCNLTECHKYYGEWKDKHK
jgi:hypothetical protein